MIRGARHRTGLITRRAHAPAPIVVRAAGLGLNALELEELLIAVADREELLADSAARAILARGRAALELELARALEA